MALKNEAERIQALADALIYNEYRIVKALVDFIDAVDDGIFGVGSFGLAEGSNNPLCHMDTATFSAMAIEAFPELEDASGAQWSAFIVGLSNAVDNSDLHYGDYMQTNEDGVYSIYAYNLAKFERKLENINKRAIKLGADLVGYETIEEWTYLTTDYHTRQKMRYAMVNIRLTGVNPMIEGWQFAAVIEHRKQGKTQAENMNIIRRFPGFEIDIPEKYRTESASWCDHCEKKRWRNDTYLLWNEKEGFKRVGKQCLKDYTGSDNPENAIKLATWLRRLEDNLNSENYGNTEPAGLPEYKVINYFAHVAMSVREFGWVSGQQASQCDKQSTSDHAWGNFLSPSAQWYIEPTPEDAKIAQEAYDWLIENLPKMYEAEHNEFHWNMLTAMESGWLTYRHKGIVGYGLVIYKKEMEKEIEQKKETGMKEERVESQHVGEIKERLEFKRLTCTFTLPLSSAWGVTTLHKFLDENGNIFAWFASTDELDIDCDYVGKATVKDHSQHDGENQTVITRCNFKKIID